MQYLLWQNSAGWHLSRTDGKTDEFTLNCMTRQTLETHRKQNNLQYTVHEMDNEPVSNGFEYMRKYAPK